MAAARNVEVASISFPHSENLPLNLARIAESRMCVTAYFRCIRKIEKSDS